MNEELKDHFTSEKILERFDSQFDAVLHAINVAENYLKSGRPPAVKTEIQNPTHIVLSEILNKKDMIVSLSAEKEKKSVDGTFTYKPTAKAQPAVIDDIIDDEDDEDEDDDDFEDEE